MQSVAKTNLDVQPVVPSPGAPGRVGILFEKASLVVFSILLMFSFFALVSHTFPLRFFKALTEGLVPIAKVKEIRSGGSRKTSIDSLWLPIAEMSTVYNADLLATGD